MLINEAELLIGPLPKTADTRQKVFKQTAVFTKTMQGSDSNARNLDQLLTELLLIYCQIYLEHITKEFYLKFIHYQS